MKYTRELHDELSNMILDQFCTVSGGIVGCLLAEIDRLQSENSWIPVSVPPTNRGAMYLLADFKTAVEYECGIPATTGWYSEYSNEWILPTGCGVSPTHYRDCITDNETRVGFVTGKTRWSDNFPRSICGRPLPAPEV